MKPRDPEDWSEGGIRMCPRAPGDGYGRGRTRDTGNDSCGRGHPSRTSRYLVTDGSTGTSSSSSVHPDPTPTVSAVVRDGTGDG